MQKRNRSNFVPQVSTTVKKQAVEDAQYDSMSNYSDYCSKEPDYTFFRQVDYYWLFDKQLKFSKRPGFYLQDELEVKDYLKMKKMNRKNLTKFLKRI